MGWIHPEKASKWLRLGRIVIFSSQISSIKNRKEFLLFVSSKLSHIKLNIFFFYSDVAMSLSLQCLCCVPGLQGYCRLQHYYLTHAHHNWSRVKCYNSSGLGQKRFLVQAPKDSASFCCHMAWGQAQGHCFTVCCLVSLLRLMNISQGTVHIGSQSNVTCIASLCKFLKRIMLKMCKIFIQLLVIFFHHLFLFLVQA